MSKGSSTYVKSCASQGSSSSRRQAPNSTSSMGSGIACCSIEYSETCLSLGPQARLEVTRSHPHVATSNRMRRATRGVGPCSESMCILSGRGSCLRCGTVQREGNLQWLSLHVQPWRAYCLLHSSKAGFADHSRYQRVLHHDGSPKIYQVPLKFCHS
mmetsp:Transcript_125377/g.400871  ORF Transcript_125377/g.400871 Transcript_125377/m.400871 type:complete len:157 (-) Transcript_125377:21-491(-)